MRDFSKQHESHAQHTVYLDKFCMNMNRIFSEKESIIEIWLYTHQCKRNVARYEHIASLIEVITVNIAFCVACKWQLIKLTQWIK